MLSLQFQKSFTEFLQGGIEVRCAATLSEGVPNTFRVCQYDSDQKSVTVEVCTAGGYDLFREVLSMCGRLSVH